MSTHRERVQRAFSTQAAAFEDARFNRIFTTDAAWLFRALPCEPGDLLLDLAAGTGHAARELAPRVRAAVAVDVTPEMLSQGQRAAEREGLANVLFMRGEADALPFPDGSFDIGLTRFALHHMERPQDALAQLVRCVRPGGHVAVADMVAAEDPTLAARQDRIERLRDPSHTRMLGSVELLDELKRLGLEDCASEIRELDRALEPWLAQAEVAPAVAEQLRVELSAEVAGERDAGEEGTLPSGFQPYEHDSELRFVQRLISVIGRRQDACP